MCFQFSLQNDFTYHYCFWGHIWLWHYLIIKLHRGFDIVWIWNSTYYLRAFNWRERFLILYNSNTVFNIHIPTIKHIFKILWLDGKVVCVIRFVHREPGIPVCLSWVLMGFLWFEIGLHKPYSTVYRIM
jgi:hypothetical protein